MASIGEGWVDGAWVQASWITGAWNQSASTDTFYTLLAKAIKTRLSDNISNVTIECERELQWSEGREIIVYLDSRTRARGQSLAKNTRYDEDVLYKIHCQVFSIDGQLGMQMLSDLIKEVEAALMASPNNFGRSDDVKYTQIIGCGLGPAGGSHLYVSAEVRLLARMTVSI